MAIYTLDWNETSPPECRAGAVTIGNFDGVHRGHHALLKELRRRADLLKGPAVAVTFDPHPLQILRPDLFQPLLTTPKDRAGLLQAQGADHVLVLRTTQDLLHLKAEEFFDEVVHKRLASRGLVEGTNFGFGRNREGDVELLRTLCRRAGLDFGVVPPWTTEDGVAVSSSRVRFKLLAGNVREAAALLGRPFHIRGWVGTGQRRGQSLGFPTANLERIESLIPGDGVYAVRVSVADKPWPGAANIGPNPTFGEQARKVEVHLMGFQGDLYGQVLALDFIDRLRDTRPFESVTQLVDQLRADVEKARQIVSAKT